MDKINSQDIPRYLHFQVHRTNFWQFLILELEILIY